MAKSFHYSLGTMTRRLLKLAAPVKGQLALSTLASVVGNLAQMGLMGFGALTLLACAGWLASPTPWGIATGISAALVVVCRYIEGVVSHAGAYHLLAHLRVRLYEKLRTLAPACLVGRQKGDILNIAVSDIETIEFFFAHTIGPMFTVILLPCTTLVLALCYHPLYAAVLLPIYLLISVAFPLAAVKLGRRVGMRYRERLGQMKAFVLESIYGLKDIQIFGAGNRRMEQVTQRGQAINRAAHGLTLHQQAVSSVPTFFVYLARISIVAVASYLALAGTGDPVAAILLSYVATASFSSTQSLTTVVSSLLETYAAAERLFLLEDTPPEVQEADHPRTVGPIREIVFDHVTFQYSPEGKAILDDFQLTVHSQEKLGIVGESGMGKSTILRLLLRFWNPTGGEIRINGIPLQQISLAELRQRIAVLEQDTFLFNGTIAENIAFGLKIKNKPKSYIDDKIKYALKLVNLSGFEKRDVTSLSGGQQQRIAIARAIVNEPRVLLLDEPLGALDLKLRQDMQYELIRLKNELGITFIYVTHDQEEALTMSDTIVVMNQGYIQQMGSPEQIYNEPENAFVADFIGESNIVPGLMIHDELVEIFGARFACVDKGFGNNKPVDVVIRPEDIDLLKPEEGTLQGIVTHLIFKGVHYEMEVTTPDGFEWLVHSTDMFPVGQQVGIHVDPFDIQIMNKPASEDEEAIGVNE